MGRIELDDDYRCLRLQNCTRCLIYNRDLTILSEASPVMDQISGRLVLYCSRYQLGDARLRTLVEFFDPVLRSGDGIFCLCSLLIRRNPSYPRRSEPWMAECRVIRIQEHLKWQKDGTLGNEN